MLRWAGNGGWDPSVDQSSSREPSAGARPAALGRWRFLAAEPQYVLIEMPHRRGGLGAAIRACSGVYRSVPMDEPDDAVSAGMRLKRYGGTGVD